MRTVEGDLIALAKQGRFDVLAHGCNCVCRMGAGIALQLSRAWPEIAEADRRTSYGPNKLGSVGFVEVQTDDGSALLVANCYTQRKPGAGSFSYDALRECMRIIRLQHPHARIGYPRIGAGLAGADWRRCADIIDEELNGCDHTLVVLGD